MFLLEDIFRAYYDCRRNKRNTLGALEFELHYETECIRLFDDIIYKRYALLPNTAFIVRDPVQREILASHFRDRIIHHLIANRLEPHLEKLLIHDVYSSRKGKGTHYGIKRIEKFMRAASDNYQRDAYILKLDISGFFMSIKKQLLYNKIKAIIERYLPPDEQDALYYLLRNIIFTDIKANIRIKGNKTDWVGLPKSKSLFYAEEGCGLPIGNLTSQIFSNIYMNEFDMFIKKTLKIQYYGRYVDDFILIHQDKDYLKSCLPKIRQYLIEHLGLTLHPKKIYFQPVQNGVLFLGTYIKPWRKYVGKRTKGNFYRLIESIKKRITEHGLLPSSQGRDPRFLPTQQGSIKDEGEVFTGQDFSFHSKGQELTDEKQEKILSQVNSYLGLMKHTKSYRLREKMMRRLDKKFSGEFTMSIAFLKISTRR